MKKKVTNPRTKMKIFLSFGSVFIVLGVVFASCFGLIYETILYNVLTISESSPIFDQYTSPTAAPVYVDYYLFNVTNPDDIKNYGAKPILKEIGPYGYEEHFHKFDYIFDDGAGTVSYYQNVSYFFDRARSVGPEEDNVTTLNAAMVLAAAMTYDNFLVREFVWPEIEAGMNLFETFTVGELLFKGWKLPTFNFDFSNYPFPILDATSGLQGTLYEILSQLGIEIAYLEDNRAGFFKTLNNSNDGLWKVNTGAKGMDGYLYVQEWDNLTALDVWHDPYCDMINGTDGSQYPPSVSKTEFLRIFAPEFCRSLFIEYEKDVVVQDVVTAYHFVGPPELLMSYPDNLDHQCFCKAIPTDVEECQENGMLNMAPCFGGAPVILSAPHFYQTDGIELAKFEGLSPIKELHETYIDIEPTTGVLMSGAKKLQMNLPLRRYGNLPSFQNVPEVIFPVLWGDENGIISKENADKFKMALTLPFIIVYSVCGALILAGIIFDIYGYVLYKRLKGEPKLKQ